MTKRNAGPSHAQTPERWAVDVGAADIATLHIPPNAHRSRSFEVDVRFTVRVPDPQAGAWHAMRVEIDGLQQWQRRSTSHNPGQTDSLDYRCRCVVGVGQALRVRAITLVGGTQVGGTQRQRLRIDAEEDAGGA